MTNDSVVNVNQFPNELLFILSLLEINTDNMNDFESPSDLDWNFFLNLVNDHRVYPLVYSTLRKLNKDIVPSYVMQSLKQSYSRNTLHMLYLTSQLTGICKLFQGNEISMLVLKGPILAEELYGDFSLRTSKDLDILVSMQQVETAEKVLLEDGFIRDSSSHLFNDWKWRRHHLSFSHPEKKIEVELHWRLYPDSGTEISFEELWQRKRTRSFGDSCVDFLGEEDLFLYLVTHGARHGWFRLRWLTDIDRILRKKNDWKKLISKQEKYEEVIVSGQAIILAANLLHTPIDQEMKQFINKKLSHKMAKSSVKYILELKAPGMTLADIRYLFVLKDTKQKMRFILGLLYPRVWDQYQFDLPKALQFLYFPLRPFLVLWRLVKRTLT